MKMKWALGDFFWFLGIACQFPWIALSETKQSVSPFPEQRVQQGSRQIPLPEYSKGEEGLPRMRGTAGAPRVILLNGVNISSVRNQKLEGVDVHIDGAGNLSIMAPHYEATEDESYHPLLPREIPALPKSFGRQPDLPSGIYSKSMPSPVEGPAKKGYTDAKTVEPVPPPLEIPGIGGTAPQPAAPQPAAPQPAAPQPAAPQPAAP